MGINEMRLLKNASRVEPQKLGVSLVAVCFIFTMTFLSLSKPIVIPIPILGFGLTDTFATYLVDEDADGSQPAGLPSSDAHENQTATQDTKLLCDFSDTRSDTCEMEGDVRIHGNSSSVLLIIPPQEAASSRREESWTIKPHARKGDPVAMRQVSAVSVQSLRRGTPPAAARCAANHSVPAVVFSTGGYMGNIFHDFTDVLIPLFVASRRYGGEVQFLVSEARAWWLAKFGPYLRELSRHEIVDFNADATVRCYPSATVGLASHKEMGIDPRRAPDGCSMADFARLMRKSFSLERESAVRLGGGAAPQPRLLIIARKRTRRFENVEDIVELAEGLGYEAVVAEADVSSDLARFARVVNSCDVLMGVHGAGLTNLVFLPANATVIQVVPLGGLGGIAWADFGGPSLDMGLRYLQYSIGEEESTLLDMYPKGHPVLKDPASVHRQGWMALREVYLDNQSVRLDVRRFKGQLLKALEFLRITS